MNSETWAHRFLVILPIVAVILVLSVIGYMFTYGRCDCDPIILDSQTIAYHLVGSITLEGDSLDRADFNGDGVVNGLDLLLTLRGEE